VRLLLSSPGSHELVMPTWDGNQFLMADGQRPTIRTFTPRRFDASALELEVQVVVHGVGVASQWVGSARPGAPAAVSGPGRGYDPGPDGAGQSSAYLLAGDETALPAIGQLMEMLPADAPVRALVEVAAPAARLDAVTGGRPGAGVEWLVAEPGAVPGEALVAAFRAEDTLPEVGRVWVAGEAAAVQRIRRHLFQESGMDRDRATVRGYWKHGRAGDEDS
jgi:NADPH-dependent ferric siderophore reductase